MPETTDEDISIVLPPVILYETLFPNKSVMLILLYLTSETGIPFSIILLPDRTGLGKSEIAADFVSLI